MSQAAAAEPFSITRSAIDPRADGASRTVSISASAVTIDRSVGGVRMRVGVPVSAYRHLVIAARLPSGQASLLLRHDDPDLDVALGAGEAMAVAKAARAWAAVLGKEVQIEEAFVAINGAVARRTKRAQSRRRSAFSRRRKMGITPNRR